MVFDGMSFVVCKKKTPKKTNVNKHLTNQHLEPKWVQKWVLMRATPCNPCEFILQKKNKFVFAQTKFKKTKKNKQKQHTKKTKTKHFQT